MSWFYGKEGKPLIYDLKTRVEPKSSDHTSQNRRKKAKDAANSELNLTLNLEWFWRHILLGIYSLRGYECYLKNCIEEVSAGLKGYGSSKVGSCDWQLRPA